MSEHFHRPQLLLSVLCAVTFIVYSVDLSFHFVWDDGTLIVNNPLIRSWSNLPQAFTGDLWQHVNHGQAYYRPLFTVWSMLNYSVFKLDPSGWHLSAIVLHLIAVLAVYDLARRLRISYWTSATAATIFALHPIHIESVSWISGVQDVLVTIFYVLAFSTFLRARDPDQRHRYLMRFGSLAFLACALLSKEMAITFVGTVALYVWLFPDGDKVLSLTQRARQSFMAAMPYALVTIAYLALRRYALGSILHPPQTSVTGLQLVLTVPYVLAFYFFKWLAPVGLTAFYYVRYLTTANFVLFVLSFSVVMAYAGLVWYWQRRQNDKTAAFVAIWPLLTLTAVLNLPMFDNGNAVHDRYVYLPSVGLALLTALAVSLVPSMSRVAAPVLQKWIVAVMVLGMVSGNVQQLQWSNEKTLFERGYARYPQNPVASLALARLLRDSDPNRSIELLKETINTNPTISKSYLLLADIDSSRGNFNEGRRALQVGLSLLKDPLQGDLDAADLVALYGRFGELDKGEQVCERLQSRPSLSLNAWLNCGIIDVELARYPEAERLLRFAAQSNPAAPAPVYWLGRVHLQTGRAVEARQDFATVLNMDPNVPDTHFRMGQALEAGADLTAARAQYEEALRLDPSLKEARLRLDQLQRTATIPAASHVAQ